MSKRRQNGKNVDGTHFLFRPLYVRLAADLADFATHANTLGERFHAAEANARLDHLASGAFSVVILGEAGVGKASLVNAFLGAQIIPGKENDPVYAPPSEDASLDAAGETIVRVATSDVECSYTLHQPWIARENTISVFSLEADAIMTHACVAALDCADAVFLVINAAAPQSSEFWDKLGNSLGRMPGNRLVIVANKLDFIDVGNRAARLLELSAHAQAAFANVPSLLGISARTAFETRQKQLEPPAVADLAPLRSALASRLATRSDASRLAVNNEATGRLADRLLNIVRNRLGLLDAEGDSLTETLQQRQNGLNDARAGIDKWVNDFDARCRMALRTIEQEKSDLANDLASKVNQLVQKEQLGWRYIEDADYRNRELEKACAPALLAEYDAAISRVRQKIFDLIKTYIDELNNLEAKWDQAAAARLLNRREKLEKSTNSSLFCNFDEDTEFHAELFNIASQKFDNEFKNRCDIVSARAFYLRCLRRLGQDIIDNDPKFRIACIKSLQKAVRLAVENSGFDSACERIFEKDLARNKDYERKLHERVNGELQEHIRSLDHQFETAAADMKHVQSQLEAALHFCEALKGRVHTRARIVAEATGANADLKDTAVPL